MADNVTLPGSGSIVASDEVNGGFINLVERETLYRKIIKRLTEKIG